jgi:hypothetical protein
MIGPSSTASCPYTSWILTPEVLHSFFKEALAIFARSTNFLRLMRTYCPSASFPVIGGSTMRTYPPDNRLFEPAGDDFEHRGIDLRKRDNQFGRSDFFSLQGKHKLSQTVLTLHRSPYSVN